MIKSIISFILIIVSLTLFIQSCDFWEDKYDIEVINNSINDLSIYLDGEFQFDLKVGQQETIKDVESGKHTFEAKFDSIVVAERIFDLDADIIWRIYK